jgi:chromosomal replication initiation ATPase DnaA
VTSKWFIVNFIMDSNKEIDILRNKYSDAEFLKMCDVNCRIGEEQVELLHLFDAWEKWNTKSYNFGDK